MMPALWINPRYASNRRNRPNSSWRSHDGLSIQRCQIVFKGNLARSATALRLVVYVLVLLVT